MKKYLFCLLILAVLQLQGYAKETEDYSLMKDITTLNYSFDFSAFKIKKNSSERLCRYEIEYSL